MSVVDIDREEARTACDLSESDYHADPFGVNEAKLRNPLVDLKAAA